MARRKLEYLPVEELVPAARNSKAHDDALIGASVSRFGYIEPIVLDERTGQIISGHGRRDELLRGQHAGDPPPDGIVVKDGKWLAPVQRGWSSKDDAEALAAGIALNQSTIAGGWRLDELAPALQELELSDGGLDGLGFAHADIDTILATLEAEPESKTKRPKATDDVPPLPKEPVTKPGDMWTLGAHRVLCGDAFSADDRARLLDGIEPAMVLTDPPFAIYGSSSGISSSVADDKMVRPFFEQLGRALFEIVPYFGHVYVHCDWRSYATLWETFKRSGLTPKNCLVWDKGNFGLGANWPNAHEFVAFFSKLYPETTMTADAKAGQRQVLNKSNILRFPRARGEDRQHNAAKPVALLAEILEAGCDPGGVVVDLFGGSGSVLAAAEGSDRRCCTIEMEPAWVDVCVARWEAMTGQKAQLAAA